MNSPTKASLRRVCRAKREKRRPCAASRARCAVTTRRVKDADKVRTVIAAGTQRGDFFEVVLSQVLSAGYAGTPSELFENIRTTNPSPYEFLINLGGEQLNGASPEMFVRVENGRVETCPIAGTIRRGSTPIGDAEQILALLNSQKDEAELTMCTDVDRNDKARICKAGSVRVEGRRMIELYSKLIHTVDYVTGELKDECDGFDALLSHMWAVTLTAPKPAAMQQIEALENSARRWALWMWACCASTASVNTGITIRTVHLEEGRRRCVWGPPCCATPYRKRRNARRGPRLRRLSMRSWACSPSSAMRGKHSAYGARQKGLVCGQPRLFAHTLGDYVRQTGADITTVRAGFPHSVFEEVDPDLVFVSPGPCTPEEFGVPDLVRECVRRELPVFGVCPGLQGMVEAFGGQLGVLSYPMHGKPSPVRCTSEGIFDGFPQEFTAGRYHSLYAVREALPDCFNVLAETEDGVIMAIEHESYPAPRCSFIRSRF